MSRKSAWTYSGDYNLVKAEEVYHCYIIYVSIKKKLKKTKLGEIL